MGYLGNYSPTFADRAKKPNPPLSWMDALGARSQGLNDLYGLPKKPPAKSAPASPQDPFASVNSQIDAILQAAVEQVQQQQEAARAAAQREAELEYAKGQALAEGLKQLGISGNIQSIFQNAANTQAGLASGYSGQIRDQAAAQAAQQQRMLSGTGQEGAVRQQGENMGNVQYGLGGAIPASTFNTQAANYAAEAALQPGFALQFGSLAERGRMQDFFQNELPKFTESISEIYGRKPEMLYDAISKSSSSSTSAPKVTYRSLANGQIGIFQNGKLVNVEGPVKQSGSGSAPSLQAKRLANGQYITYDPASGKTLGKPWGPKTTKKGGGDGKPETYSLQMKDFGNYKQAWDPRTNKLVGPKIYETGTNKKTGTKGPTASQKKLAGQIALRAWNGEKVTQDVNGEKVTGMMHMSYQEAMREGLAQGIPLAVMQQALNRFWTKPGYDYDFNAQKWVKSGKGRPNRSFQERNPAKAQGGKTIPTSWKATHVTDGLGWGTKTAEDLFPGPPGTPVGAPENGRVVKHGSAQGGQSVWFLSDSGYMYWLGHIESDIPIGTRLRKGDTIATVSADHPRPHVHIDKKRWGSRA